MQKILIACDKFKGTFSSKETGSMIAKTLTDFETEVLEVSDGGDGLIECLRFKNNFSRWKFLSFSPDRERKIQSKYLYDIYTGTAVLEASVTLSMNRLRKGDNNILKRSSYGLGYDLRRLFEVRKPKRVVIGVGGTSTDDLFLGGANALGFKFLDSGGNEIFPVPENFLKIEKIIKPENPLPENIIFDIAADVKNPLCGTLGASKVFAPQKGASKEQVEFLDNALRHVAKIIKRDLGADIQDVEGAGAGGGIGGGLLAFLGGKIISGADFVLDTLEFDEKARNADLVITGEGKFDAQSLSGKLCGNIISRCRRQNRRFAVICGKSEISADYVFPLFSNGTGIETAKQLTEERIKEVISTLVSSFRTTLS